MALSKAGIVLRNLTGFEGGSEGKICFEDKEELVGDFVVLSRKYLVKTEMKYTTTM